MSACAIGIFCQNVVPPVQRAEGADGERRVGRKLRVTFVWGAIIAAAVAAVSLLPKDTPQSVHVYAASGLVVTLVAMLLWTSLSSGPVLVTELSPALQEPLLASEDSASRDDLFTSEEGGVPQADESTSADVRVHQIMAEDEADSAAAERHAQEKGILAEVEPRVTLLGALASPTYWLLYAVSLVGTGAGLTFNNNLAQVCTAPWSTDRRGGEGCLNLPCFMRVCVPLASRVAQPLTSPSNCCRLHCRLGVSQAVRLYLWRCIAFPRVWAAAYLERSASRHCCTVAHPAQHSWFCRAP